MLANAMVFSRFRHWTQCMAMPERMSQAVEETAQELVWRKKPKLGDSASPPGDDENTALRRWMKKGAQYGDRTHDLGLGLLPWRCHSRAIQVMWILRYLDGTRGDWKTLLDRSKILGAPSAHGWCSFAW